MLKLRLKLNFARDGRRVDDVIQISQDVLGIAVGRFEVIGRLGKQLNAVKPVVECFKGWIFPRPSWLARESPRTPR